MNHSTSDDSEIGPTGLPLNTVSTLTDLQVKAYENRMRERLMAKYPTLKLKRTEARRLEEQIQKLVQIYAEGRHFLHGDRFFSNLACPFNVAPLIKKVRRNVEFDALLPNLLRNDSGTL
jgi:hypothetical protein